MLEEIMYNLYNLGKSSKTAQKKGMVPLYESISNTGRWNHI